MATEAGVAVSHISNGEGFNVNDGFGRPRAINIPLHTCSKKFRFPLEYLTVKSGFESTQESMIKGILLVGKVHVSYIRRSGKACTLNVASSASACSVDKVHTYMYSTPPYMDNMYMYLVSLRLHVEYM